MSTKEIRALLKGSEQELQQLNAYMARWSKDTPQYMRLMNRALVVELECDELQRVLSELAKERMKEALDGIGRKEQARQAKAHNIAKQEQLKIEADKRREERRLAHEARMRLQQEVKRLREAGRLAS